MAFTPANLGVIVQPIGSDGMRFASYRTDDAQEIVLGPGYFQSIARHGVRVSDLIFVQPETAGGFDPYIVCMDAIDASGHGTGKAGEITPDWSDGFDGAPALTLPDVMRRKYIDVGAYCSLTDTNDAHAGILAAFDDGEGREIVFTNPTGGTRYYRSLTRPSGSGQTNGALIMPKRCRVIMEPGAILDFSSWANSGNNKYYLYAEGTVPTVLNLATDAAAEDSSITLADGSTIEIGDDLLLVSEDVYTTQDSPGTKGEWIRCDGKSGANTVLLAAKLRDSYTTANTARVYRMSDLAEITIEGVRIIGAGAFATDVDGDRGIRINNGKNCWLRDVEVYNSDSNGIMLGNILNGGIDGARVIMPDRGTHTNTQYGVTLTNMCENVHLKHMDILNGSEACALSVSGEPAGLTRDCSITFSRFRGASRSGFATHDIHTGIEFSHNVVEDCEQGIDNRVIGGIFKGNYFRHLGAFNGSLSAALRLGSGASKVLFEGNTVEGALRGVYMPDSITHDTTPGDIDIIDNDFRQIGAYGVGIFNTVGSTAALGTVTVQGNRFEGDGTTAMRGVEIEGKWKPIVVDNTFRGGNGNRSIYLHATDNGAGTDGPVNPVITDNRRDSSFTAPLIQHGSGRFLIERNSQIDATVLPSATSASALTVPTDGNFFNVTGTTTINTIGNAANYVGKEITLIFASSLTVTHNANAGAANDIQLAGAANFSATANDTLTLVSNGTVWLEKSRAVI